MAYRLQVKIGNFTFLSEQEWSAKEDAAEAHGDLSEIIRESIMPKEEMFIVSHDASKRLAEIFTPKAWLKVEVAERKRFGPGWSACK